MKTVCDVNSDANKKVEIKDLRLGEAVPGTSTFSITFWIQQHTGGFVYLTTTITIKH